MDKNQKTKSKSKRLVIFNTIVALVLSILVVNPYKITNILTNAQKVGAVGDVPAHQKERTNNNDGTYKLSLTVKGDVTKTVAKANVIVVFDTSGSMLLTQHSVVRLMIYQQVEQPTGKMHYKKPKQ